MGNKEDVFTKFDKREDLSVEEYNKLHGTLLLNIRRPNSEMAHGKVLALGLYRLVGGRYKYNI